MRYVVTVELESDLDEFLVREIADQMLDDSMFAMHEVATVSVVIDE